MTPGLKLLFRREYLRQHQEARRAAERQDGARRIDVTLKGQMLDDYATVRRYIEGLNRLIRERNMKIPPIRLSDTEVIRTALSYAAATMREEDDKAGLRTMLD